MTTLDELDTQTREMDVELGLYLPADVKEQADMDRYDDLFVYLRTCYYVYPMLTKEKVQQLFINFYNAGFTVKLEILNELENNLLVYLQNSSVVNSLSEGEYLQQATDIFTNMETDKQKAEYLFLLKNGFLPQENEDDITEYLEQVIAMNAATQKEVEDQKVLFDSVGESEYKPYNDAIVEPKEFETPEEVVSRYLKGSGVYDPATRNSGFRVDTDIEK